MLIVGGIKTPKKATADTWPAKLLAEHSNLPSLLFCTFVIRITPPFANISTFLPKELALLIGFH